jgi:hypothetical protein
MQKVDDLLKNKIKKMAAKSSKIFLIDIFDLFPPARCSLLPVGGARLWPARQRARRIALLPHQQLAAVAGLPVWRRLWRLSDAAAATFSDISPWIAGFSTQGPSQTARVIFKPLIFNVISIIYPSECFVK